MKAKLILKSSFGDGETVEYITQAQVEIQNGSVFISYTENPDDYTSTTSKIGISDGIVTLNRFGAFPASFLFCPGQTKEGFLTTLIGRVDVSIDTSFLDVLCADDGISVKLRYSTIFGDAVTCCSLSISCLFKEDL